MYLSLYCSIILLTLFATSCYWRETPIVEFSSVADFFQPRRAPLAADGAGGELGLEASVVLSWLRRFVGKGGEIYTSDRLRIVL